MKQNAAFDADIMRVIGLASAAIIVAIGLIGSISYSITRNTAIHKLKTQDLIHIADAISGKIDARIERAKEVSLFLAANPQVINWMKSAANESNAQQAKYVLGKIKALVTDFDYTNSFIVNAVTGHYWDETGRIIDTMSTSDSDDDWFFSTIASGERITIQFDYHRERHDTFVFVDALVGDLSAPPGVAGVGLGLGKLSDEIRSIKYGEKSTSWLPPFARLLTAEHLSA